MYHCWSRSGGPILANENDVVGSYKVEGIGYDFIPEVLDRSQIDKWVKTKDTGRSHSRRLIKEKGLLVGGCRVAFMQRYQKLLI